MKKTFLAILAVSALISCAGSKEHSPILVERGIKSDERNYDVVQEGYGIDPKLKKIFLAGYIAEGMNKNMVHLLWGTADRELENGRIWEYIDYKTGEVITRLKWEEIDPMKYKGADWTNASKLIEIEGDPYGGSPPMVLEDEGTY